MLYSIVYYSVVMYPSDGLAGCDGLETGHGSLPELGLYQCYGKVGQTIKISNGSTYDLEFGSGSFIYLIF